MGTKIDKKVKNITCNYLLIAGILNFLLIGGKVLSSNFSSSFSYTKLIPIFYYSLVPLIIGFFLPSIHTMGKASFKNHIIGLAISASVTYIALTFIVAILTKNLALSPYDTSVKGILYNIASYIPPIIASIFVRSYSVNAAYRIGKHPYLWIVIISLFLAGLELNYIKLFIIRDFESFFIYLVQEIIPKVSLSFLLTSICLIGGRLACIYYMVIYRVFIFIFPFIPSLPWILDSVIGIAYPVILAMFIWEEFKVLSHWKSLDEEENIISLSACLILIMLFSWFLIGVFNIYPSLILTGSMEPMIYPGDIIIIRKFKSEEEIFQLKSGDLINFKVDNFSVTHRIVEVNSDEAENLSFITKGDNNDSIDSWVLQAKDLNGRIVYVIPKIGKPILLFYSLKNIPEEVSNH